MPAPSIPSLHGRVAALTKNKPGDPAIARAKSDLRAANLAAQISRVVDQAPPLSGEQLDTLSQILRNAPRAEDETP